MTNKALLSPGCVFEVSWEVCNKVGGIYTVLSTRAKTLQEKLHDKVFFIGPDVWRDKDNPLFLEDQSLLADWRAYAANQDRLHIRVGRWNIPGDPIVFLVDYLPFYERKNEAYGEMWNAFGVDSLHAYGDYDESCVFALAAGKVVESYYRFYGSSHCGRVVLQAHEWMTAMAMLHVRKTCPEIATVFTTHATTIGRSIAGNGKPLYDYLPAYQGDQMAFELNVQSKHSVEKQAAHFADCFTTVSDITNEECRELLDKPADVVLMNGFENDFVPQGAAYTSKRRNARRALFRLANCLLGETFPDDTLVVGISGRHEVRNKGIDCFVEAMRQLGERRALNRKVLAVVAVPAWVSDLRSDVCERLLSQTQYDHPLPLPYLSHWLHNMNEDVILNLIRQSGLNERGNQMVRIIYLPCYLDGRDGLLNIPYYDFLPGQDLSVYPSYYEPWGYTPLESVAFHVPTITTSLSGFGRWVQSEGLDLGIGGGVEVIHRTDGNSYEVAQKISEVVETCALWDKNTTAAARRKAKAISAKALWKHFFRRYEQAYDRALRQAAQRCAAPSSPSVDNNETN